MKLVYIASPYAGDTDRNIEFAKQACRYCINSGNAPVAVHLLYPQILNDNDPAERKQGLRLGRRLLEVCDEFWVCGNRISDGMKAEMEHAARLGIPIKHINETQITPCVPGACESLSITDIH